jgi:hypothetical protein
MIELRQDKLVFSFPEVHKAATLEINFRRTLRIPNTDKAYPLPPGLGNFPLKHVEDYEGRVPQEWITHGGILMPMYQSEAMWIDFSSEYDDDRSTRYPFAVKIATGKVCAVSGEKWVDGFQGDPQNYVVVPEQPWLDGYCVEEGVIRQFVAAPLGDGVTAEEQVTGKAEVGGVQIQVFPMKREVYLKRFEKSPVGSFAHFMIDAPLCCMEDGLEMGLAPGGRMRQEIYEDPYDLSDWDTSITTRCFVHIANSMMWHTITGKEPPYPPRTEEEYRRAGLPWFDWYDDRNSVLPGGKVLAGMESFG